MTIDYEAAGKELNVLVDEGKLAMTTEYLEWEWAVRIVNAALGDTVLYKIGEPVGFYWLKEMIDGGALVQVYPERSSDE